MKEKICGIYKIQSIIKPEKCYIGSAINIIKRRQTHFAYLKRGDHHSSKLQRHYNKYGKNDLVFSILLTCDKNDLLDNEQFFLDAYDPYFNHCKIADSFMGKKHTEKTKEKLRQLNLGKKHSEETILKMIASHQNMSDETKNRMSESHKGRPSGNTGKKHSDETRRMMSELRTGKPHKKGQIAWNKGLKNIYSAETREKIGIVHKGNKYRLGKKHSEETKLKISILAKERKRKPHTEETKQKMRHPHKQYIKKVI